MADIEHLKSEAEKAEAALAAAADRRNEAIDALDTARVEAMTPELVEEAEALGINPRNFEGDEHLTQAINYHKEQGEQ